LIKWSGSGLIVIPKITIWREIVDRLILAADYADYADFYELPRSVLSGVPWITIWREDWERKILAADYADYAD